MTGVKAVYQLKYTIYDYIKEGYKFVKPDQVKSGTKLTTTDGRFYVTTLDSRELVWMALQTHFGKWSHASDPLGWKWSVLRVDGVGCKYPTMEELAADGCCGRHNYERRL